MLCANPNAQLPVWLKSDDATPADTRPTFYIRPLTEQEMAKAWELMYQGFEEEDGAKQRAIFYQVIAIGLLGWKNIALRGQPIEYSADVPVASFLHRSEIHELASLVANSTALTEADRGNSPAPSTTAADGSAPNADPAVAA